MVPFFLFENFKEKVMKKLGMLVTLLSLSVAAYADDFKIVNSTNNEFSFKINHVCSSEFGSIPAHSNKTVTMTNFQKACAHNLHDCVAKIYVDNNCSGKHVATVSLDTDFGLHEVLKDGGYSYTWTRYGMMIAERA